MSIISYRNTFLNAITDVSFPSDINVLSTANSLNEPGYTTVTVNRNLNWNDGDYVYIEGSIDYNGNQKVKYVNNGFNTFDIPVVFTSAQTGTIKETTHRYKDNINEVKNFPAVLLGLDKTTFMSQNKGQLEAQYEYYFFVIDRLDNYGDEVSSETLELAQDFVDTKATGILLQVGQTMGLELDELEPMEHIINDKEVVASMGKLKINT